MNRKLIEEAAKAMRQGYERDGRISSFFTSAEAAFAVFEKAQCKRCGKIAEGYAFSGDDRYCHPDDGVDCYTLASHELTSLSNQAFIKKAQAPTDDEREDMIAWLMRDHGDDLSPLGRDYTDAEIADMLRRPAQGEPTDGERLETNPF